ncbi:uncharacterized protein FIESC28_01671 [Fusarium coffeatum]|uniref:NAD-dependent epimerase/dehydratase domain-containing protein n=1 Tax=Fusarium coffeatum TaxID=231269 RepID=A0A366S9V6_9HYPO|nr:uncharacterized protein FIESC28_01671 [Fusarium coffeatum]RBR25708.1 hypothetical protein FIESC28_01671 [Fusarium coffeatum]
MTIITTLRNSRPRRSILVTGGAGFIGGHLVEALLAEGCWKVVVVDNFDDFYDPAIKRANLAPHMRNPDLTVYEADIQDMETMRDIFAANDFVAVAHLAARAGVLPSLKYPNLYFDVNVTGTLNLLNCCKEFGVEQFVFGSSSSVYGLGAKAPFSESYKAQHPISPYAASKSAAELLCHTYSHLYQIRCVCLRFFTVYGPRQRPDLAIHKFTRLIHQGKPIPLFGDGSSLRDYTYVDDIVQGIFGAINYKDSIFEAINLGESQTIKLMDLISVMEGTLGIKALIDWRGDQPGDMPVTYADISKAGALLGYMPKTKINQGIVKFVDWYLSHNAV